MKKILLVEDEEKTRKLLKLLIMEMGIGFEVTAEASNGLLALKILKEQQVDLILTDIRMPLLDGIEFAKRALEMNSDYKIIIVTAYDDFEYARQAIVLGVSNFILKPLKRSEIKEALLDIQKKLDKKQEEIQPDSEAGNKNLIEQVVAYVKCNMSDPDLNLLKTAEEFYVNFSYLSRQFKKEQGETFSEYLLEIRIKQAILYMETTKMKAYEIAKKVGFHDVKYFSKCFKKVTGKSIQEYRKDLQKI